MSEIWRQFFVLLSKNTINSIWLIAREDKLVCGTMQRILKEEDLHAFYYTRVQELRLEDYARRKRFYKEEFLRRVNQNLRFPYDIQR